MKFLSDHCSATVFLFMLLIPIIYSEYSKNETNSNVNKKTIRSKNLKQRLSNYVDQIHFGINNHNNLVSNRSFDLVLKGLERLVHIDLKGAPPRLEYFRKLFPFLKDHGATGILLEYEDMFPFTGVLQEARHGNAYSLNDIIMIRQIARENGMYIVPLIQTYGHLEWLLKVKTFAHLREDYKYPQVITPCLEETYAILFDMLNQVMAIHRDAPYFHIGCDEVYHKLIHSSCQRYAYKNDFTSAFMTHLLRVAGHIKTTLPNTKILFWDDMLHNMNERSLMSFKNRIMSLELSPMLWGYMENVREYFRPELFEKYGRVFERIWIATAYKGAQGELASLTNIESRYKNHVSWLDVMEEKVSKNILKFSGVALTGWSRYDHFLALCELLPQALPSLVFNLKVLQVGPLSDSAKYEVWSKLGCKRPIPWYGATDAYGAIECTNLPGYEVYDALLPLENTLKLQDSVEFAKKYMTPLNLDYNYLHKMRSIEVLNRLTREYFMLNIHRNIFLHACQNMYFEETGKEWIAVYLAPYLDTVYELMMRIKNLTEKNDWSPRPLPVQLKQYPGF